MMLPQETSSRSQRRRYTITSLAELEDHALACQDRWKTVGSGEFPGAVLQQLQLAVGMLGLMVEEHQAAGAGCAAEGDRVGDARVPPADPRVVLFFEVLGVVQNEVGAVGERTA